MCLYKCERGGPAYEDIFIMHGSDKSFNRSAFSQRSQRQGSNLTYRPLGVL